MVSTSTWKQTVARSEWYYRVKGTNLHSPNLTNIRKPLRASRVYDEFSRVIVGASFNGNSFMLLSYEVVRFLIKRNIRVEAVCRRSVDSGSNPDISTGPSKNDIEK